MQRLEYKYLLPIPAADELRRLLAPFVTLDAYAAMQPSRAYTVRSLYFDTSELDFYHDKIEGVRDRLKLRVRAYGRRTAAADVWLEVKRKSGRVVLKQRARLPYAEVPALFEDGDVATHVPACDDEVDAREQAGRFLYHLHARKLRPIITTVYEREAWTSRAEPWVRVTIDRQLRYQPEATLDALFNANESFYSIPGHGVIEVKTLVGIPKWLQSILASVQVTQEAVSKYVICVAHRESTDHRRPASPAWSVARKGAAPTSHVHRP